MVEGRFSKIFQGCSKNGPKMLETWSRGNPMPSRMLQKYLKNGRRDTFFTTFPPNMGAAFGRPTQRARRPSAAAPIGVHIWSKNGSQNGLWGFWDHFGDHFLTIPDGRGSPPDYFSDYFRWFPVSTQCSWCVQL